MLKMVMYHIVLFPLSLLVDVRDIGGSASYNDYRFIDIYSAAKRR